MPRLRPHLLLIGDALQFMPDNVHAGGPLVHLHLQHLHHQAIQFGRERGIHHTQVNKAKRCERRINARQQLVKHDTQAVDIRPGSRLRLAILLWRGETRRAKSNRIPALPRSKVAGNAKIDQVQAVISGAHNIARLHIAKDDRRLLIVQVMQHCTELNAESEYSFKRQACSRRFQPVLL